MRILVEFTNPDTDSNCEITMDCPEIEISQLREIVLSSLEILLETELPSDFNIQIREVASGTIH